MGRFNKCMSWVMWAGALLSLSTVAMAQAPAAAAVDPAEASGDRAAQDHPTLGVIIQDVASAPSGSGGVVVVDVQNGSAAERAGLRRGDVIVQAKDTRIASAAQFKTLIAGMSDGQMLDGDYVRNGGRHHFQVTMRVAVEADPAIWGVYAKLMGGRWRSANGVILYTYKWLEPGKVIVQHSEAAAVADVHITRGEEAGQLLYKVTELGGPRYVGQVQPDGSVLFVRDVLVKTGFRVMLMPDGELQRQWLDFKRGKMVGVHEKDTLHFRDVADHRSESAWPTSTKTALAEGEPAPAAPTPVDYAASDGIADGGAEAPAGIAPRQLSEQDVQRLRDNIAKSKARAAEAAAKAEQQRQEEALRRQEEELRRQEEALAYDDYDDYDDEPAPSAGATFLNALNTFSNTYAAETAKYQQQAAQQQQFMNNLRREAEAVDRRRRNEQERQRLAQERTRLEQLALQQRQQAAQQQAAQQRQMVASGGGGSDRASGTGSVPNPSANTPSPQQVAQAREEALRASVAAEKQRLAETRAETARRQAEAQNRAFASTVSPAAPAPQAPVCRSEAASGRIVAGGLVDLTSGNADVTWQNSETEARASVANAASQHCKGETGSPAHALSNVRCEHKPGLGLSWRCNGAYTCSAQRKVCEGGGKAASRQ